jgi:Transport and Golgi organisation 2
MCVLTYIPNKNGHITFTHNRDEHIMRPPAIPPARYAVGKTQAIYPKDPQSNGTWFALQEQWVCCLLNGGFVQHIRQPKYMASRGTVIPAFLKSGDTFEFMRMFDPVGFEPFTLIVFDLLRHQLLQFTWDEHIFHVHHLDSAQPHIWSSSTLYNLSIKTSRQRLFKQFLDIHPNTEQIFDFHSLHKDDPSNSLFVNIEDNIKTVSITQVSGQYKDMVLYYRAFYPLIPKPQI